MEEEVLDSTPPEILQLVQPGLVVSISPGWGGLLDWLVWWEVTCFQQRALGISWCSRNGWGRAQPWGEAPFLAELGRVFLWAISSPVAVGVQAGGGWGWGQHVRVQVAVKAGTAVVLLRALAVAARGRREAAPVLHDFCCVHGGTELHRGAVPCWCRARLCHCLNFFFGGAELGIGQACCWGSRRISAVLGSTKGGVQRAAHVLSQVDDG